VAQDRSATADGVPEETDAASLPEESGPAALAPGTRIGEYQIGRRLGIGSMGAVYEGLRVADGKPVAIKLLAAALAGKPTARARFLNEAKLTARVPHPHVVAVIASGEAPEGVYLVMDLLEGEDLARRLHRSGPMSVGEAIDVLGPVCDALAAAHRASVVHRDLKPSNIFLAVREGLLHPMLLDFGVATDEDGTGEGDAPGSPTWNGVGTPMYLAPELVADHRATGPASDQYALGAILYETLTGEPPYAADNLQQLLQTIAAGHPPSARARQPEISVDLDAVVLRAMSADPQARFPSVEDLARALRPFAASPATPAPLKRRRPPSSPAIALEAATPSPFVSTLVPEHQAETGPWFVAPDAHEIPEDDLESVESDSLGTDRLAADAESWRLEDDADQSPGEGSPSSPARALPAVDWQAVSSFTATHRRIVMVSGIAIFGLALLVVVRPGHSVSRPISVPLAAPPTTAQKTKSAPAAPAATLENMEPAPVAPAALPTTVEKTEPAPVAPAAPPTTAEKTEPTPAAPAAPPATLEKAEPMPAAPAAAPATVGRREPEPAKLGTDSTISPRADATLERPKAVARRARPATATAESPTSKIVSPAPAATPRAHEGGLVRMHNGVPLLD